MRVYIRVTLIATYHLLLKYEGCAYTHCASGSAPHRSRVDLNRSASGCRSGLSSQVSGSARAQECVNVSSVSLSLCSLLPRPLASTAWWLLLWRVLTVNVKSICPASVNHVSYRVTSHGLRLDGRRGTWATQSPHNPTALAWLTPVDIVQTSDCIICALVCLVATFVSPKGPFERVLLRYTLAQTSVLARIWIFFKKRSYWNLLGSYLQKRGVILSTAKSWQMYIKYAYYMPEQEITSHLDRYDLLNDTQHGFMRGRSCLTNLLTYMEGVTRMLDSIQIQFKIVYFQHNT